MSQRIGGTVLLAATLALAPAVAAEPVYRARGQDPNWVLTIGPQTLSLTSDRGTLSISAATPPKELDGDDTLYRAVTGPGPLTVTIRPGICRDTVDGAVLLDMDK